MQKLDPELSHPPERSRDIKGEELLAFLEKEKEILLFAVIICIH